MCIRDRGYYITIQAKTGRAYEQYSNTATLTTTDNVPIESGKSVILEDLDGGIEAGEPHSVRLEKRSAEDVYKRQAPRTS